VFLARVEDYENQSNYSKMASLSDLQPYWDEGTVNISDPRVYAAKKTRDADNPSFHEAMHVDNQEQ
jgi:deoxyribodipyrimidine photolyase